MCLKIPIWKYGVKYFFSKLKKKESQVVSLLRQLACQSFHPTLKNFPFKTPMPHVFGNFILFIANLW